MYYFQEQFPYVVEKPKTPRVAFGSVTERMNSVFWPHSAVGSFESRQSTASQASTYSSFQEKYSSKLGYSSLISQTPRFALSSEKSAPVGSYSVEDGKPIKQCKKPFNIGKSLKKETKFLTPGPSHYPYHKRMPEKPGYCLAFGKRRLNWPSVAIFCTSRDTATCWVCQERPIGDYYYNFKTKLAVCRMCMKRKLKALQDCEMNDFKRKREMLEWCEFKPVRHCSFYHTHCGRNLYHTLMTKQILRRKLELENYLYPYQPFLDKRYV
uniref:Uncharacterized protein n=2 Tax=Ceratitis capitata TaxID=7213 RepID=W8BIM5_CERCA